VRTEVTRFSSDSPTVVDEETLTTLGDVVMATVTDCASDDSEAPIDAEMTVDKLLKGLLPEDAKLLRMRIGEEAKLVEVAKKVGCSKSAVARRRDVLLAKVQRAAQYQELV
jgi:hypothetical protein